MQEDTQHSDRQKRYFMMIADALILSVSLWAAVALRYGDFYKDMLGFWWLFPTASFVGVVSFLRLDLYRAIVRYIGPSSMLPVMQGVTLATLALSIIAYITQAESFPRSAPMIFWFISIIAVGGGRLVVRAYFYGIFNNYLQREPVAIYGAGESGAQLAITLLNGAEFIPVVFIDDNQLLRGNTIHGIRVHNSANLSRLVDEYGIKRILLAIPSATLEQRGRILDELSRLPIQISTVPDISQLITGQADVAQIEAIDISDLLGRDMVPPDTNLLRHSIEQKSVLVTGAGGTIGSELCRKILQAKPKRLILFDNSEFALYALEQHLLENELQVELVCLLGSVLDQAYVARIMETFSVNTVYHAAAYKHVPMVERNIVEGIRNNVLGTWYVAQAALQNRVEKVVLISTDKAVRATSVMGVSKRLAELVIQAFASLESQTQYCMVRFGNVLGSSGSILPLFTRQIEKGGPVTVTHKEADRFFMTTSEAAELVIQAGAMAAGGDLFLLDMGEPVRIYDFAEKMIHLHGKRVGKPKDLESQQDFIDIVFTGLRPGEKLREELIIGQRVTGTEHPKIMKAKEDCLSFKAVEAICLSLEKVCESGDYPALKRLLKQAVPGYVLDNETVDPVLKIAEIKSAKVTVIKT
ncbi:MAG: nucleoside-diphosphate sugar epimerase/dehydratase [Pseudomonadota bacterium]|nr:nucleoside-diphosphate sugar epimerase/dehydratase [Pseudomonadota bacterium]